MLVDGQLLMNNEAALRGRPAELPSLCFSHNTGSMKAQSIVNALWARSMARPPDPSRTHFGMSFERELKLVVGPVHRLHHSRDGQLNARMPQDVIGAVIIMWSLRRRLVDACHAKHRKF